MILALSMLLGFTGICLAGVSAYLMWSSAGEIRRGPHTRANHGGLDDSWNRATRSLADAEVPRGR